MPILPAGALGDGNDSVISSCASADAPSGRRRFTPPDRANGPLPTTPSSDDLSKQRRQFHGPANKDAICLGSDKYGGFAQDYRPEARGKNRGLAKKSRSETSLLQQANAIQSAGCPQSRKNEICPQRLGRHRVKVDVGHGDDNSLAGNDSAAHKSRFHRNPSNDRLGKQRVASEERPRSQMDCAEHRFHLTQRVQRGEKQVLDWQVSEAMHGHQGCSETPVSRQASAPILQAPYAQDMQLPTKQSQELRFCTHEGSQVLGREHTPEASEASSYCSGVTPRAHQRRRSTSVSGAIKPRQQCRDSDSMASASTWCSQSTRSSDRTSTVTSQQVKHLRERARHRAKSPYQASSECGSWATCSESSSAVIRYSL